MQLARAQQVRAQIIAARSAPPVLGNCTKDTLRCADARQYDADLRPCCRGHIRQIVSAVVPVLERLGITFWADYGTLLGAVRNPLTTWADYPWLSQANRPAVPLPPGIVPHDKDADFGVFSVDWPKLKQAAKELERLGYNVLVRSHGGSIKVRLSAVNRTNLDLFTWREHRLPGVNGIVMRRVHYISVDTYKGRDFPRARLEPMAHVEWEGLQLPAPNDPAEFCAFRYGAGWRTPIPKNHDGIRR